MATIKFSQHTRDAGSLLVEVPADGGGVKAVRDQAETFGKRAEQYRESSNLFRHADTAVERAEAEIAAEAAASAEDGGAVPAKKLVKKLRAAQDERDEARIVLDGRDAALRKAHAKLRDVIRHHTPALRAAAIDDLDADILKLATAHARLRELATLVEEHLGTLGMVERLPKDGHPVMMVEAGAPNLAVAYVGEALDRLTMAIGNATDALDAARGAAKSKPDVVVPVPDHETVEEPAVTADPDLGEMEIGGDDGE
ncbi:hypothetical protein [Microbacterium sp.]|uniref:hypothetical protein n=1 Tax=Microbacterium sp. TaxID=51671 RepID=UPI003C77E819